MHDEVTPQDWYERRSELRPGQVFITHDDEKVMLDRAVPGDGTKWYVANWHRDTWIYMDATIEPCDLCERLVDSDG